MNTIVFFVDILDAVDPNFTIFRYIYLFSPHKFLNTIKYALIQQIFGLEKYSLHEIGVEFHQKLIGNVYVIIWFMPDDFGLKSYGLPGWTVNLCFKF